jgi:hypothetical protein
MEESAGGRAGAASCARAEPTNCLFAHVRPRRPQGGFGGSPPDNP